MATEQPLIVTSMDRQQERQERIQITLATPIPLTLILTDVPQVPQQPLLITMAIPQLRIVTNMDKRRVHPLRPTTILATEILSTVATTQIQVSGGGDRSRESKRPVHPISPKEFEVFELLRTNGLHHLRL